jgi:hypothetical protein
MLHSYFRGLLFDLVMRVKKRAVSTVSRAMSGNCSALSHLSRFRNLEEALGEITHPCTTRDSSLKCID